MYTNTARRMSGYKKQGIHLVLLLCLFLCHTLALPVRAQSRSTAALANPAQRTNQSVDDLVDHGATLLDQGAYAEAIATFDQALALDATHARAYVLRGEAYRLLGELDQALADLHRALGLTDDDANAYRTRGTIYVDLGQYAEALADYNAALALAPNDTWTLAHRGYAAYLANDYTTALTDLNAAIRLNPQYTWAIVARGATYNALAEYQKALLDLTRAVSLDPDYDWGLAMRGSTYRALGEYEKAIADLTQALALTPTYSWAQTERGRSYQELGDYERALADFNAVIEQDPAYDWAWVQRGMLYDASAQYEAALADFTQALAINPTYDWALAQRGETYQALEAYEEALADFTAALAIDATYGRYYALRADLLRIMERYEEALEDANQAVERTPDDEFAWGVRGYIYRMQEQYEAAVTDFTQAIALDPSYGWAYTMRGELYQLLGQDEDALADFEQANRLNGSEPMSTPSATVTPAPTAAATPATVIGASLAATEATDAVQSLADAQQAVIQIEAVGSFSNPTEAGPTLQAGRGSGFIIDPSGIAVTNNHVVTGGALFKVYVEGQAEGLNARVLGVSECADLAVIDIEGDGFPYLRWYEEEINVGLDVYAAGYPLGDPEYTLTRGIIAKARANGQTAWSSLDDVLQHDADINPGNSGGPLLSSTGQVVGINYAVNAEFRQSFAIGRAQAMPIIEQLRLGQDVDALGINGEAFSDGADFHGIWVYSVQSGSPADQAGVQGGDFILTLENIGMAGDGTMQAYCEVVRSHSADDTLAIEIYRRATGELCSGQLNGRSLVCTASAASPTPVEAAPTPTPESENQEIQLQTIEHDSGQFSLSVPVTWPNQQSTETDGMLQLMAFSESEDSGAIITLALHQQANADNFDQALDEMRKEFDGNPIESFAGCVYVKRERFATAKFQGAYDYWDACGTTKNRLFTMMIIPTDGQAFFASLIIFWPPTWDLGYVDQMIDSITVPPSALTDVAPTISATVVVQTKILNIRTGPGTNYGTAGQLKEGARLPVIAQAYGCAWLQVQLPDSKQGWIAGQAPYTTLEGNCAELPQGKIPPAPVASGGGGGNGCILFQNQFNDEATVTLTSKDGKWNKTFKIGRKANYRECLPPGSYTYTVDVPPPWGSVNGEVAIQRGRTLTFPIHGS